MSDSEDFKTTITAIADPAAMADFIDKWAKSGGSERSNYKLLLHGRLVRATLVGEEAPIDARALSRRFTSGRQRDARITELMDTLTELGEVQQDGERYFLPRD